MHPFKRLAPRLTGLALTLTVCLAASAQPSPPWSTFAHLDDRPQTQVAPDLARLLFLRPASGPDTGAPVDIWIDGRYHTTVLPGGFSEALVCPGSRSLEMARQTGSGPAPRTVTALPALAQQTRYLLIQTQADETTQSTLNVDQAHRLLPGLRRQSHTLSRLPGAKDCLAQAAPASVAQTAAPPAGPTPAAAVATEPTRYTLAAEMLFNFAGHKPQHLSEQGQTQILRLGRRIKEQIKPGQVVLVQGHTDPMGPPALNQRLSLERAQTVSRILINGGLPARQVRAEGLGSSQLLVKDCQWEAKNRTDKLDCNRPNRRVEITLLPAKN